jgi:hypothetical protein
LTLFSLRIKTFASGCCTVCFDRVHTVSRTN